MKRYLPYRALRPDPHQNISDLPFRISFAQFRGISAHSSEHTLICQQTIDHLCKETAAQLPVLNDSCGPILLKKPGIVNLLPPALRFRQGDEYGWQAQTTYLIQGPSPSPADDEVGSRKHIAHLIRNKLVLPVPAMRALKVPSVSPTALVDKIKGQLTFLEHLKNRTVQ
jgi:hypothetical protein